MRWCATDSALYALGNALSAWISGTECVKPAMALNISTIGGEWYTIDFMVRDAMS